MILGSEIPRGPLNPGCRVQEIKLKEEIPTLALLALLIFLANFPLFLEKTYQNLSAFMIDYLIGVLYAFNGLGESLQKGSFFLWGPEMGCGVPVLAYYLTALAYPFSMLFSLFDYPARIISFYLFHFEVLGLFSYLVFRKLGISKPASLLTAGWNVMSGYSIWVSMVPSVMAPLPWFYLVIYLLLSPGAIFQRSRFLFLIIGFSLLLLSGDPEQVLYAGYFGGVWLVLYWWFNKAFFSRKIIFLFGLAFVFSCLLSLDQLLPTLNFLPRTIRSVRPSYEVYLKSFFDLKMLGGGVLGLFSRKFINLYFSFLALGFAFWGGIRKRREPVVCATLIIIVVLVLLLLLPKMGLGWLQYQIPLFSHFIRHYKLGYLFQFFVLILAGQGLDCFWEKVSQEQFPRRKSLGIFSVLIIIGFLLAKFNPFLLLPLSLVFLLWYGNLFRRHPLLIMSLLLIMDVFPYLWHPPYPFFKFTLPRYWEEYAERAKTSEGIYRLQVFYPGIYFLARQKEIPLPLQIPGALGGESFDFYMSFPLKNYADLLSQLNPEIKKTPTDFSMIFNWPLLFKSQDYLKSENRPLFNMLGVRWLFLYQFSLKSADRRDFLYDPAYFWNLARPRAYGRYQLAEMEEEGRKVLILKSEESADFYYTSDFSPEDQLHFRLNTADDHSWFLIMARGDETKHLLFARWQKSDLISSDFFCKIPAFSQEVGFLLLKSGQGFSGWLEPFLSNEGKTIKYRTGGEAKLFENTEAFPRGWIVHQARTFKKPADLLKVLANPKEFDGREMVLLLEDEKDSFFEKSNREPELVKLKEYQREKIKLNAELHSPGFLVWMDQYYPGWRAYVNGKEQKILKANLCFRALLLDAGKQEIVFRFHPYDFRIGLYVKIVSCLFLAGILFCCWLQRIRSSS